MNKVSKISISLPAETLNAVERERKESGETRSEIIRRSIEKLLREKQEKEISQRYVEAYRKMPENEEEVRAAHHAASIILAEEPW